MVDVMKEQGGREMGRKQQKGSALGRMEGEKTGIRGGASLGPGRTLGQWKLPGNYGGDLS